MDNDRKLSKKVGNKLEADFKSKIEKEGSKHWFHTMRLYDTTSARGSFLPAQPGDFLLSKNSKTILVETKSSYKTTSLRSCLSNNMSKAQAGNMGVWCACGNIALVVFASYNINTGTWDNFEVWDGEYVSKCRKAGKTLDKNRSMTPYKYFSDVTNHIVVMLNGEGND